MTETTSKSGILKKGKLLFALLVCCLLAAEPLLAQTITFKHQIAADKPAAVSIDRYDNIYLTDQKNNLYQFNPLGQLQNTYSPPRAGRVHTVEAWNLIKIFLFYDDQQRVVMLDRFLREIASFRFSDYTSGTIRAATLSADDKFWLFNESDFALVKLDTRFPDQALYQPLNLTLRKGQYDIRFLREYQNNVFLVDKTSGIYVFDNMGNYKKQLPFAGLSYIGFQGNELYFLRDGFIHFFDLYNFKERTIGLPPDRSYQNVLVGEKYVYLLSEQGVDVYLIE